MLYQIWIEGWSATGGGSDATFIGEVEAPDFLTACRTVRYNKNFHYTPLIGTLFSESKNYKEAGNKVYDWGCRVFDNETDARKSFG